MLANPRSMQRGHQEVTGATGAIAGEDPAGAIGAMRRRRETDEQQSRGGIAETGDGPPPVLVCTIGTLLLARDAAAVVAQARTALA